MATKHSYEQIANDFELWAEYVDPDANMTQKEFDALSVEEKIAMQVEMFGKDEYQNTDDISAAAASLGRKGGKSTSTAKVTASAQNGKLGGNKTGSRHFYAEHSYMGLNFTYDSPCWMVYVFDSKAEREEWLKENEYDGRQYVAWACSFATACKIAPDLRTMSAREARRVEVR